MVRLWHTCPALTSGRGFFPCGPVCYGTGRVATLCAVAMKQPDFLRKRAEAAEHRAADVALSLSGLLLRPSHERGDLGGRLADLATRRDELAGLVMQMRQVVCPPAVHERRPVHGAVATPQYLRDLRMRLRSLDKAMVAAGVCAAGHEWPLMPDPRPVLDLGAAQDRVIAQVLTGATDAITPQPQTGEAVEHGCFPDIGLLASRFMHCIHLAHRILLARKQMSPVRFIDIGCGGGLKVAMAAQVFARSEGLDYDAGYVAAAERAFLGMGATRCRAFEADGMTFDRYGDYDVLYLFKPMYEPALYALEARVVGDAPPVAIIIAPGDGFEFRAEALGLTRIAGAVYVKGTGAGALASLVAETRRIGPHIVCPDHVLAAEAGWVAPLWQACQANGIDPDRLHIGEG